MNFKEWLLISEIAEPVRPLGKVALRNIIKDGGTWRGRSVKEYRFKTTKGNEVKLHFDKLNDENGYDVMFYVNNTQYDNASGGDSEILANVLWLMRKKADQLKADVLTFTAQKGDGDTKVIRNMDISRFKPVALQELAKMRSIITSYQIRMVKPNAEVFVRLGRPVPPDYPDLDKEKYLKILSAYESQIDSVGELVTNTTHLFQDLSRLGIDASGFIEAMKRLWDAQESNTERGFHSHRNRREFVWEKLMNRHFSSDWSIEKSGVKFRLSRKESLSERTLYHGTIADYEGSIRQYGLQGGWHGPLGSFVSQHYDSEEYGEPSEEDEVVFATDKQELGKAVNAMVHHISQKLKKEFHDVTDNDIRNYGLLVIIKDGSDAATQYSNDDRRWAYENPPRGAEEGDYFASSLGGDVYLRGSGLIRFLKRNGEWPRHWGSGSAVEREKYYRGRLGAMAISRGHEKSGALEKVSKAPLDTVRDQLRKWK